MYMNMYMCTCTVERPFDLVDAFVMVQVVEPCLGFFLLHIVTCYYHCAL